MQRPIQYNPKRQLWWCSLLHIVNDGYVVSLALLLPFIASALDLTYTQSGLLKAASYVAISAAQIPAGLLSESIGEILTLGLGTAWFSLSYMLLLLAFSYPITLMLILASGIGGGAYHPVGTALISNVYPPEKSGPAIGTLNFSGDVGKVLFPLLAGVLVIDPRIGWQGSLAVLGIIGLLTSLLYLFFFRRDISARRQKALKDREHKINEAHRRTFFANWGIKRPGQFTLYSIIGFLDIAVRNAAVAFLGFLLIKRGIKGDSVSLTGYVWLMSLTFFGGAVGKLLCGMPIRKLGAKRIILITELLMILGCYALPSVPPGWVMVLFLPIFGFMLNGTSSVIYIGLAPTFDPLRRSRGYALYYTLNFLSAAASPPLFGLIGDAYGLNTIFYVAGAVMLLGLPFVIFLKDD